MTDLTDRMRTCAAAILAGAPDKPFMEWQMVYNDAADLLIEASNALEAAPAPLGDPMEVIAPDGKPTMIIPPMSLGEALDRIPPLPYHEGLAAAKARMSNTRACPKCDSRAQKTARRVGDSLMLKCPVCGHQWTWRKG